jgi:hypothetical protein
MEEKKPIREKLDYSQVLFEMMMQAMRDCHEPEAFSGDISLIDGILAPYYDDEYLKNRKEIEQSSNRKSNNDSIDYRSMREKPGMREKIRMDSNFSILKELMRLARRKGLLPLESISHVLGEPL